MSNMDTEAFPRGGKLVYTSSAENRKRKNEEKVSKICKIGHTLIFCFQLFVSDQVVKNKKPRREKSLKKAVLNESSFQAALKLNGTLSYKVRVAGQY